MPMSAHVDLPGPALSNITIGARASRRELGARGFQVLLLGACIAAVYILSGLAPSGTDRSRVGLSIGATTVVAVGFSRIKQVTRYAANRLVFGRRPAPLEVVGEFTDRVIHDYAGDELVAEMARVIAQGTGADRAVVWLLLDGELVPVGAYPDLAGRADETDAEVRVLVRDGNDVLGALSIKKKGSAVSSSDVGLLSDLASLGGIALRNVRLRAELQARVDELDARSLELKASRRRIVEAQDDERRSLERDIHDGIQQYLTALGMNLGRAKILLAKDPVAFLDDIQKIETVATETFDAIQDLSTSLYPRELRVEGVIAALRRRTGTFPFVVEVAGPVARYDSESEACVYFTCLEAVQNAAKHARPSRVSIRIEETNQRLTFTVEDDGPGFDVSSAKGVGLRNMSDRVAAFGGTVDVDATPGRGACVRGWLPLPSASPARGDRT
jgi:signal transduction histidine kinase